jgi:EmrB/QacA subfamily drug resistance transporter
MRHRGLAMGVLIFASFMDLMDATIVNVALPSMQRDLGASPSQLEWIVSAYLLAFAVLLITGGRLGDIVGRRRVFLSGVIGFTVASVLAAVAPNAGFLIAVRALQGGCAALMVPQVLSSAQVLYPPSQREAVFGAIGAVSGLAAVIGPVLGGWLVTADLAGLGWRTIFLINVPVGLLLVAAAVRWVPDSRADRPLRLDLLGVGLAGFGVLGVVYPLVEGRSLGWPTWIWVVFAAGVAVLGVFVAESRGRQRRDGSALLPMGLFANRGYSAGLVTQTAFQGALGGFSLATAIYLQLGLGFSAIDTGLTLLPFSLGAMAGTVIAVPLSTKVGKPVMTAGALIQAGATLWVMHEVRAAGADLSGWDLAAPFAIAGVGLILLVIPLIDVALARVPLDQAGAASGAYGTFQQFGAALGIAITGVVFFDDAAARFANASGLRDAFLGALWVPIGGYLLAAAATVLLPGRAAVQEHARALAALAEADAMPAATP